MGVDSTKEPKVPRVTLARELRISCEAGPRAWALMGILLTLCLVFPRFTWVVLAMWLVFVFPLALGGLIHWALLELVVFFAVSPRPMREEELPPVPRKERVVKGRVVKSREVLTPGRRSGE